MRMTKNECIDLAENVKMLAGLIYNRLRSTAIGDTDLFTDHRQSYDIASRILSAYIISQGDK